jgi:uncharacterized protein YjgD (DUF1641 family)
MSETNQQPSGLATAPREDVLDYLMKPEVQESLTVLVQNLPKLAEMVTTLTKAYDFAQNIMTDRVFMEDLKTGVQEFVEPIQSKVKQYASAAIEAGDRARADDSTVGLFGLLKLLKDPQVQSAFRFLQAFLTVLAEKKQQ